MKMVVVDNCVCLFVWMLCSVGQALIYHLSDVKGMSRWPDKFGTVGLSETATQDAVRTAGSFMLKARELQQLVELVSSAGNRQQHTLCRIRHRKYGHRVLTLVFRASCSFSA